MNYYIIMALFWVTAIVIPITAILSVAYATFWRRRGRPGATRSAIVFGAVFIVAVLSNPLLNCLILAPLYGGGVSKMLTALRQDDIAGRSREELVSRFGRPDKKVIPGHMCDEELYFDRRPWFYITYPDSILVRITDGKVVNFAYYH